MLSMHLKTNLHLHTAEDPEDRIPYTAYKAIDYAAVRDFNVLALTLHDRVGATSELHAYAQARGILLISGIEKTIEGAHVLILNAAKSAEQIKTLSDLAAYRAAHPECFVIAPHPYYYGNISLKEKLDEHHALFDAIEQSWFYKGVLNRNLPAQQAAQQYSLPFIATSDTHVLRRLDYSYAVIEAAQKTPEAIFSAIKGGSFVNISAPAPLRDVLGQAVAAITRPGQLSWLAIIADFFRLSGKAKKAQKLSPDSQ